MGFLTELGAIINVASFRRNPHLKTLFQRGLWGFSERYRKRWKLLSKGTRVLFYGDKGIRIAGMVESTVENREPVDEWVKDPMGYPYQAIFSLLNKNVESVKPIWRVELVEKFGIPLAKQGFRGTGLVLFGDVNKEGITYPIEKFNEIWSEFLRRNDLKPSDRVEELKEVHPPSKIEEYVSHARELLRKYPDMSEATTISALIDPLLELLGWNTRNPDEVQREFKVRGRKGFEHVDMALMIDGKPHVFIEVKSSGSLLEEGDEIQVTSYAFNSGVDWCVLTNGREIRVYDITGGKSLREKLLFTASIDEYIENFDKIMLLSKESVKLGRLREWSLRRLTLEKIINYIEQKEQEIVEELLRSDGRLSKEAVRGVLRTIIDHCRKIEM